jgi:autotransporter-associated beta strand protein
MMKPKNHHLRSTFLPAHIALSLGLAVVGLSSHSAQAANEAWSTTAPGPADGNFTGGNWTEGMTGAATPTNAAATGDALYFGTSAITTLTNDLTGATFAGFTFNSGASAYTISGNSFALSGALTNNGSSLQTFSNAITLQNPQTITGVGDFSLNGNLTGGQNLTKSGSGTRTLTGTNTYTGLTPVSNGKLVVNGSISSSAVTVQSGATLGGMGTVGALTDESGGYISPGNSPGILTVNGNYNQAGTLSAELNGTFAEKADGSTFFINGTKCTEWKISYEANYTGTNTGTFTGGNDVAVMAVPETRTALLGGLGMLALLRRRRQ